MWVSLGIAKRCQNGLRRNSKHRKDEIQQSTIGEVEEKKSNNNKLGWPTSKAKMYGGAEEEVQHVQQKQVKEEPLQEEVS